MRYRNYKYIYPPRPKNAISPDDLDFWDDGSLIAQPKLNGSNSLIFTNGVDAYKMGRHKQILSNFKLDSNEIKDIYRGDGSWMVINGEYMNKSKSDENLEIFNHKLVVFDILVYNGNYMVGSKFSDRVDLMDDLYGQVKSEKEYLFGMTENIYRVKTYRKNFKGLFDNFIKIDMLEGLVMKRANARLERGNSENNNHKTQIKCRKKTKLYKY